LNEQMDEMEEVAKDRFQKWLSKKLKFAKDNCHNLCYYAETSPNCKLISFGRSVLKQVQIHVHIASKTWQCKQQLHMKFQIGRLSMATNLSIKKTA
jgi:hypothetical protein